MKTIQIRVPDHIHEKIKEFAEEEGVSMNSFVVSSVSNEVVRQETRDFFKKAAANFTTEAFAEVLAAIPDAPIPDSDRI